MFTEQDIALIKERGVSIEEVTQQIENFRNGLQTGQEVVTSGGIYGKVKSIDGNIVNVEVANGVVIKIFAKEKRMTRQEK